MQTSLFDNTRIYQPTNHNATSVSHPSATTAPHKTTGGNHSPRHTAPIVNTSQPVRPSMAGKITEIILQDEDEYNFQLLMPLLAQLSKDDRWFAWIAPPKKMPKAWLIEAGIDINKIIVLQPDKSHSALNLATKALETGTCHAVVSWSNRLETAEFNSLQTAAVQGESHAILIRPR